MTASSAATMSRFVRCVRVQVDAVLPVRVSIVACGTGSCATETKSVWSTSSRPHSLHYTDRQSRRGSVFVGVAIVRAQLVVSASSSRAPRLNHTRDDSPTKNWKSASRSTVKRPRPSANHSIATMAVGTKKRPGRPGRRWWCWWSKRPDRRLSPAASRSSSKVTVKTIPAWARGDRSAPAQIEEGPGG